MSSGNEIKHWLCRLGLERYAEAFVSQDVDLEALRLLTDADLRELGVTLGHRKRILQEIARTHPSTVAAIASSVPETPVPTEAAQRRLVSVLFCDMVGSTEIARKLDPEDMRQLLCNYQDRVAGAVTRFGGHLAQYLGDGVMAFFGWPMAFEDQTERAIRAGLEAIAAVTAIDAGGVGPIRCRAAVATGEVVVGDLGDASRQEGAIAGETPNLAARLQQVAAPGQLVISSETAALTGDVFEVVEIGMPSLKGFDQQATVYRVVGVRTTESRFDATRGSRLSRFVGRQSELAFVFDKWALAKSGAGQAILVSGEAGIGKSRLIRSVLETLSGETMEQWQLQCSPFHSGSALYPVIQSLGRALEQQSAAVPNDPLVTLEALLTQWGAAVEQVAPIFADLLSLDVKTRYARLTLEPQDLKRVIFTTLIEHCLMMARRSPLLLVVEDTHWIDPTTLELIEQTIAGIAHARLLIIITHRSEWRTDFAAQFDHAATLSLGRLPQSHTVDLARELVGSQATEELIDEIAVRTGGVPMFVEEVARSILEAGSLDSRALYVPATLQGALTARLDGLSVAEKEVVQTACVVGREFQASLIAMVCKRPITEIECTMATLILERIIIRAGVHRGSFAFRHALIQDAAYQSLLRTRRRHLHSEIAAALEISRPDVAGLQPEFLAHHLSEANLPAKALPLWHRAGERALARYANVEAIQHFTRAIEVAGQLADPGTRGRASLAAEIALAEALLVAGRTLAAMEAFQRAAANARVQSDKRALISCALGFDEAQFLSNEPLYSSVERLQEALDLLEADDIRERCHLSCRLTRAYAMLGNSEPADDIGRTTIELARGLGEDRLLVEVMLHGLLMPSGGLSPAQMQVRLEQADKFLAQVRSTDEAASYGQRKFVGRTLSLHLYQAAEFGERQRMDAGLRELEAWSTERDDLHLLWVARHGKAMQAILDGDLAAAEVYAEEAQAMGHRIHDEQVDGVYGMQMFTIRREQGRLSEVAAVVRRLVDNDPGQSAWRPGFAVVASDLGFMEPARRIFSEIAEAGFVIPRDGKRTATLAYLSEVCTALGDEAHAQVLYRLLAPYAYMTITTGVTTICYGAAARYLGLLSGLLGDLARAEAHFETALEINRKMLARPWIAHTQADLARLLQQRGRSDDLKCARLLCDEAALTANDLGMRALAAKLERQPQNRQN